MNIVRGARNKSLMIHLISKMRRKLLIAISQSRPPHWIHINAKQTLLHIDSLAMENISWFSNNYTGNAEDLEFMRIFKTKFTLSLIRFEKQICDITNKKW